MTLWTICTKSFSFHCLSEVQPAWDTQPPEFGTLKLPTLAQEIAQDPEPPCIRAAGRFESLFTFACFSKSRPQLFTHFSSLINRLRKADARRDELFLLCVVPRSRQGFQRAGPAESMHVSARLSPIIVWIMNPHCLQWTVRHAPDAVPGFRSIWNTLVFGRID